MSRMPNTLVVSIGLLAVVICRPWLSAQARFVVEETIDFADLSDCPTIRVNYGLASSKLEGMAADFADVGMAEIALGFSQSDRDLHNTIEYQYTDLSLAKFSTRLGDEAPAGEIDAEIWRVGMNTANGYGYPIRGSAILPYHAWGLCAAQLTVDQPLDERGDRDLIDLYHEEFRFGSKMEGGLRLQLGPMIELSAGYERTAVFRRWLVWKWAGSAVLEHISQGMLDAFIDEIHDRSPQAAPIVHFVLKNALAYAWYELRTEEMNWPFDGEAPIMLDTYKVGLAFVF